MVIQTWLSLFFEAHHSIDTFVEGEYFFLFFFLFYHIFKRPYPFWGLSLLLAKPTKFLLKNLGITLWFSIMILLIACLFWVLGDEAVHEPD